MRAVTMPERSEYVPFHDAYMAAVAGREVVPLLGAQLGVIDSFLSLSPEELERRYAPGKWSVREVIGHLIDSERVLSYRLLCFARGEGASLPGYDESRYADAAGADSRPVEGLVAELRVVRQSTIALIDSLDEAALMRMGTANGWRISTRAMVYIIAGHFEHHLNVLRERYTVRLT